MRDDVLISLAREARKNSYSPYSGYPVGSALLTEDGRTFSGTNVENASYGLSICAERNTIFSMVTAGRLRWSRIVVVTKDGSPPCGACLQVLAEFADRSGTSEVILVSESEIVARFKLKDLLPNGFELKGNRVDSNS